MATPLPNRRNILIVDDSPFARRTSRRIAEQLGYAVEEAASGAEALLACQQRTPDAVLLDLVMAGGLNGDEVLVKIRRLAPGVPVIIVTADSQESTATAMRTLGAMAVLTKPVKSEDLGPALAAAIATHECGFDPGQTDALAEIINIGYGRAAAALSMMSKERVTLRAPSVIICPVGQAADYLASLFHENIACVNQAFAGPIAGAAMLMMDTAAARTLAQLLEGPDAAVELDAATREMLAETGHVLLNACLGVFGNLLRVQVSFALPSITIDAATALLQSMKTETEGLQHTVLVRTQFTLRDATIAGYLVIVLAVTSLARLRAALDTL